MDQNDVLESLFDARSTLTALIVELAPTNDEQRERLVDLVRQRDAVNASIRAVVDADFLKISLNSELSEAVASLRARTKELDDFEKTIDDVERVIGVVDQMVQITTTIARLVSAV